MIMRPDEEANISQIERDKSIRDNIKTGVKTGVGLVAGAGATQMASKIMPFLNRFIPSDLAVKGINKISPKIGDFLKRGQSMGLDIEEGLNFIKEKFSGEATPEKSKEKRNVIEQYSPELHQFLDQEIRKGRNVLEAGAIAQNDKKFIDVIKKLTKDHNTQWSKILEAVYGGQGQAPIPPQQETQQQSSPQSSNGQQALMQILDKINQRFGGNQ